MRIVSWNSQGQTFGNLRKMLNEVEADACLLQEPYKRTHVDDVRGKRADPKDIAWTGVYVQGANSKDNYFFAHKSSIQCVYHLPQDDPRPSDIILKGYDRKYLVAKFKNGDEAVRIATFHAPYGLGKESKKDKNIMAVEYLLSLCGTDGGYKRPPKPTDTSAKQQEKKVDLIMADTNVYDNSECARLGDFTCVLNSQTGRGNLGGNVDRIFLRKGMFPDFRMGRILWEGTKKDVARLSRGDAKGKDIILPKDDGYEDWDQSDHCPIYFDTDSKQSLPKFDSVKAPDKRKTDTEELFMLDYLGKGAIKQDSKKIKEEEAESKEEMKES